MAKIACLCLVIAALAIAAVLPSVRAINTGNSTSTQHPRFLGNASSCSPNTAFVRLKSVPQGGGRKQDAVIKHATCS